MKTKYLLLVGLVVVLASCSSAYRNGQTPDDVYFSPAPASESYVVKNNSRDRDSYRYSNDDRYSYTEERNIRQGIQNPRYRNSVSLSLGMGYGGFNSFGYDPFYYNAYGFNPYSSFGYNPYYGHGFNNSFGYNPFGYSSFGFNPYYNYNPYFPSFGYNPHYGNSYYPPANYYPVPGKSSSNRGARIVNLGSYTPPRTSTAPRGISTPVKEGIFRKAPIAPVRTFESRTNAAPERRERSDVNRGVRRVFTPSERKNYTPPANNNRRTEKTNTPPVRRFDPPVRRTEPPVRSSNTPPVRNSTPPVRSTNNPPVRTFDPTPAVSNPAPAASSTNSNSSRESSSTPVRTFRNNN